MSGPDDLVLLPAETVVLVVDLQDRLCATVDDGAPSYLVRSCRLVDGARLLGVPVVVTERDPSTFGATAALLRERLARFAPPPPTVPRMELAATSSAALSRLLDELVERGVHAVIVAGTEAHVSIHQTVRGLAARGVRVHVAVDAVGARDVRNIELARELWSRAGAVVSCVETVLFDLAASAGVDAERAVARLLVPGRARRASA